MEYTEDEYLLLSGIQHFSFCRRQWALIHVEQQWQENLLTVEGMLAHEHCHDEDFFEKRGDLLITRGMRVFSRNMGIIGQCDVVEFYRDENGCSLYGHKGKWLPYPIEYKRGKSKEIDADLLQLCAQAMCLEQMLNTSIPKGAIYYKQYHRREEVDFDLLLRDKVISMLKEMHDYHKRGYTPLVKKQKGCSSCSLNEICLPTICHKQNIDGYYERFLGEEAL